MELKKREEVVKALECCEHIQCQGEHCPYHPLNRCREKLRHDCFALIKELIEENDRVHSITNSECERCACELLDQRDKAREEAERYKRYYFHHEYDKWEAEIKADTVRRMQERLNDTKFRMCGGGECYIYAENIDVIAKELLEENNV